MKRRISRACLFSALLGGAALLPTLTPLPAAAYCRTTTCDPTLPLCSGPDSCCLDENGCDTAGLPIAWPSACVSYNVQEDGSPLLGISAATMRAALQQAYHQWLDVGCGASAGLSLTVEDRGLAECGAPEFNQGGNDRNANVWMFRDDVRGDTAPGMRVDIRTLAVTLVSFNFKTAEIYDVDVEMNSGIANFTVDDELVDIDLLSVVTHEAGHFLGLDHTREPQATMGSGYTPGSIRPRKLAADDISGICAIYPTDRPITRDTCEPRGKHHAKCEGEGCDCRMSPGRSGVPSGSPWGALALGLTFLLRRRFRAS